MSEPWVRIDATIKSGSVTSVAVNGEVTVVDPPVEVRPGDYVGVRLDPDGPVVVVTPTES